MVRELFEGFLEDEEQYAACEAYWRGLVDSIAESVGQAGEWPAWIPRSYGGVKPIDRDLLPICDGWSPRADRAFRILQAPQADQERVRIAAWLNQRPEDTELPTDELVISLVLSEDSSAIAQALLSKWMLASTTVEEMKAYVGEVLPPEDESRHRTDAE